MPKIVDPYTVTPDDIEPGDEMLFIVKAIVVRSVEGKLHYRLYRCHWDGDVPPQGMRIHAHEDEVCQAVFPSLAAVGEPDCW